MAHAMGGACRPSRLWGIHGVRLLGFEPLNHSLLQPLIKLDHRQGASQHQPPLVSPSLSLLMA